MLFGPDCGEMETSNGLSLHFNTLWSFSGRKVTGDKLSYFVCVPCRSRSFEIDILVESPCPRDNHKSWILWRRMEATGLNCLLAEPTCLFMVKCVRDSVENRPTMTLGNGQAAEWDKCNGKSCHHLLTIMLFRTCRTLFLLRNTNKGIWNNVLCFFPWHYIESSGPRATLKLKYPILYIYLYIIYNIIIYCDIYYI